MRHKTTNILRLTNITCKNIQREKLFHSRDNLLITFSGGQDSAFCLLVLYLLKDKGKKKIPFCTYTNLFKTLNAYTYQSKERVRRLQKRIGKYKSFGSTACTDEAGPCKNGVFATACKSVAFARLLHGLCLYIPRLSIKRKNNLVWLEKNQITEFYLTFSFVTNYTVLWCNHFWQKDAFFTMVHVSKLAFSKKYTIHLFAPVQKVLSEQEARYWRHKTMQRSSFFTCQPKFCYKLQQSRKKKKKLKQCISANKRTTNFAQTLAPLLAQTKFAKATLLHGRTKTRFLQKLGFMHFAKEKVLLLHSSILQSAQPERTIFFRTQMPPRLQSGQFFTLFLNFVLLARPLLSTLRYNQSSTLVKHSRQKHTINTTFVLSKLLCVQGHNKSDRAEAILFNLIRGAGINGISTLQWKQSLSKSVLQNEPARAQTKAPSLQKVLPTEPFRFCPAPVLHKQTGECTNLGPIASKKPLPCKNGSGVAKRSFAHPAGLFARPRFEPAFAKSRAKATLLQALAKTNRGLQNEVLHARRGFLHGPAPFLHGPGLFSQAAGPNLWYSSKKAKFYCANDVFYPILSDFLKEIPIIYLDVFRFKEDNLKKKKYSSKKANFYYKQANLHKIKSTNFEQQKKVKTKMFYYQLKYKQNKFFCC